MILLGKDIIIVQNSHRPYPIIVIGRFNLLIELDFRSSDGNTLVVSSTDGYCSIINFKRGELGEEYIPTDTKENINEVWK